MSRKERVSADGCRLCGAGFDAAPRTIQGRSLRDCPRCRLLQVVPEELPSAVEERARYDTHENDPEDPGYRDFLDRLAAPLVARLPVGAEGLDFGCGPGPTLSLMLAERGFPTVDWDPFYRPEPSVLARRWDFVTATEVIEHLHRPAESFALLARLVRPGGLVAVMTRVLTDAVDLETWWYLRDPTHVAFWRPATLEWVARERGWTLERPHADVAIWRVPDAG